MDDGIDAREHRLGSRDEVRRRIRLMVDVHDGRDAVRAEALDLSRTGIRLRTRKTMRQGARLRLEVADTAGFDVIVMWTDGPLSGARFDPPLAPPIYAALVAFSEAEEKRLGGSP